MTRQLEALQKERNTLSRLYRAERKRRRVELFDDPDHGVQFRRFHATLNHFGPDHAERMIDYVRFENERWIVHASDEVHIAVREAVSDRIATIRENMGLVPYDDSLPDEPDDVWQICKRIVER